MSRDLIDEVQLFYKQAEWCSRQAEGVVNPQVRQDFIRLAQKWLTLARSYEIVRSVHSQREISKGDRASIRRIKRCDR